MLRIQKLFKQRNQKYQEDNYENQLFFNTCDINFF